jgi:hypothetical protein
VGKFSDSWIGVSILTEIANTLYTIEKRPFKLYDPRPINISTFYIRELKVENPNYSKTESIWTLNRSEIEPKFNYVYNLNGKLYSITS